MSLIRRDVIIEVIKIRRSTLLTLLLYWLDKATLYTTIGEGVGKGWMKIDEGRAKVNLPPVEGGDSCYIF